MVATLTTARELPLAELERSCRRETRRYKEQQTSDQHFCLEIFRRALEHRPAPAERSTAPVYADEDARDLLVTLYTDYIRAQINRAALQHALAEELIQEVWRNFWMAANSGLVFTSLGAALTYLQRATVSVVIKSARQTRARAREDSLQAMVERVGEEPLPGGAGDLFDQYARQRFRERCRELISDELEHRIFWLRHGYGFTPKEIVQHLARLDIAAEPPLTPRRVSDLLERTFRRLSQDTEIRTLLEGG